MTEWPLMPLEALATIAFGTRVTRKRDGGQRFPVYGGGGPTFNIDRWNREDCYVVARFGMSPECVRFVKGQFFLNDSGLTVDTKDQELLSQAFLNQYLKAKTAVIYEMGRGTAQKNLDVSAFNLMTVPIPPLDEQERIVAKLDEASEALIKLSQNVEELEKLEQALWSRVLTQATEPSVTTWPMVPFTAHVHVYQPETIALKRLDPGGEFPVFGANGKIGSHSSYNHEDVELLLGCRGSVGSINWSEPRSWINGNAMVVRPEPEVLERRFVAHFLSRSEGLRVAISGTAQPQITRRSLQSLLIPLPPLDEQKRIVAKLDEINDTLSEFRRVRAARTAALEAFKTSFSSSFFSQAA